MVACRVVSQSECLDRPDQTVPDWRLSGRPGHGDPRRCRVGPGAAC